MEAPDLSTLIADMQDTSRSSYQRTRSFEEFLKHPDHLTKLSIIEELLADENRPLRNDVVRGLVRNAVPDYYHLLAIALDDTDDYVRREALRGLAACTQPEVVAKVRTLAETASYSLKADAERTLKSMEEAATEEVTAEVPVTEAEEPPVAVEPVAPAVQDVVVEPEKESNEPPETVPVVAAVEDHKAIDMPPPLPEQKPHQPAPPPPLPKDAPPPLPQKKEPPQPSRPEVKRPSTRKDETPDRHRRKEQLKRELRRDAKREVKHEKSSCGPLACGCLILALIGGILGFIFLFTFAQVRSEGPRPSVEIRHFQAPQPVPYQN